MKRRPKYGQNTIVYSMRYDRGITIPRNIYNFNIISHLSVRPWLLAGFVISHTRDHPLKKGELYPNMMRTWIWYFCTGGNT